MQHISYRGMKPKFSDPMVVVVGRGEGAYSAPVDTPIALIRPIRGLEDDTSWRQIYPPPPPIRSDVTVFSGTLCYIDTISQKMIFYQFILYTSCTLRPHNFQMICCRSIDKNFLVADIVKNHNIIKQILNYFLKDSLR